MGRTRTLPDPGLVTVASVLVITVYLVISGISAILEIGLWNFLFGDTWDPASSEPKFGILPFILSSIYGTAGASLMAAIVVLTFDVTEQVNAKRNRQEFTANVSHELKTPLQSILNSAQLLQSGLVKPEDMQKFTGYICSEAERLLQLINDIIRLSQLDEGGEYPKENVELYQVCSQVLQTLIPAADQRNITVKLLGDEVVIPGIRQLAYELIYNLCDNAIRTTKTVAR